MSYKPTNVGYTLESRWIDADKLLKFVIKHMEQAWSSILYWMLLYTKTIIFFGQMPKGNIKVLL